MLQGTASDAGKSLLAAAFCRIFKQEGHSVAPFKSQNMSLNSYVTWDGKEISQAQGMQAEACGILATTDMNPILLKPKRDALAQVIVHGIPYRDMDARSYREQYLQHAEAIVRQSLNRLREAHDVVVIEGAGSPAEINLKDRDIVNMRLAEWADAPVLLVADIDRGGMFASIVGTLEILTPEERQRIKGVIVNKFRGDKSLLQPGLEWLEEKTGKPVLGVVPFLPGLCLEDEDGASLEAKLKSAGTAPADKLDIAVIRLPRIANFTDFEPLVHEEDVHLRYISAVREWGKPDVVLLPGSKNTMEDLLFLRETGLEQKLLAHVQSGGHAVGICAGFQMMGRILRDPHGTESDIPLLEGMGFFPTETVFEGVKKTVRTAGIAQMPRMPEIPVEGYEIHMGRTIFVEPVHHPLLIEPIIEGRRAGAAHPDGACILEGRVWGTYVHGILYNDAFRRHWLNCVRKEKGWTELTTSMPYKARREAAFDMLAEQVRMHVDMKRIERIMEGE